MSLRNGEHGYGWVTKLLHWLTVLLVAGQFSVGWSMDLDAGCDPVEEGLSGSDTLDAVDERLDRLEDACEADADRLGLTAGTLDLPELHLLLGLSILLVAVARPLWRRRAGLPPWSAHLSEGERRLVHWTERALMVLLFVIPLSGVLMVAAADDDWLPLHVGAHLAFFVALAAHLYTNLRPRILPRMLPGG